MKKNSLFRLDCPREECHGSDVNFRDVCEDRAEEVPGGLVGGQFCLLGGWGARL